MDHIQNDRRLGIVFPPSLLPCLPSLSGGRLITTVLVDSSGLAFSKCPAAGVYTISLTVLRLLSSPSFILEGLHKDGLSFLGGRPLSTSLWYCLTFQSLYHYLPVCGTEWLSWSQTWWEVGFDPCCGLLFCIFTYWEEKSWVTSAQCSFQKVRDSCLQTQSGCQSWICPQFSHCLYSPPLTLAFLVLLYETLPHLPCFLLYGDDEILTSTGNAMAKVLPIWICLVDWKKECVYLYRLLHLIVLYFFHVFQIYSFPHMHLIVAGKSCSMFFFEI